VPANLFFTAMAQWPQCSAMNFIAFHSVLCAIAVKKELISDKLNDTAKNEEAQSLDRAFSLYKF
jgi:hypothetical protein